MRQVCPCLFCRLSFCFFLPLSLCFSLCVFCASLLWVFWFVCHMCVGSEISVYIISMSVTSVKCINTHKVSLPTCIRLQVWVNRDFWHALIHKLSPLPPPSSALSPSLFLSVFLPFSVCFSSTLSLFSLYRSLALSGICTHSHTHKLPHTHTVCRHEIEGVGRPRLLARAGCQLGEGRLSGLFYVTIDISLSLYIYVQSYAHVYRRRVQRQSGLSGLFSIIMYTFCLYTDSYNHIYINTVCLQI